MRLGELLARDGLLAEAKLAEAVSLQQRVGGRLGTVLVEMGLVDLETLTIYLGLEHGIPIATGATLDRAKYSAVKLLTAAQATRLRTIPLLVHDRQLIAAIDDPHDMIVLDELATATGCRVIPRIAPEIRIHYYLERYYGVPRPRRFRRMGELPRGPMRPRTTAPGAVGPSLPGLPPRARAPITAPTPAPPLRPVGPAAPAAPPQRAELTDLELEAHALEIELESDDAAVAEPAPMAPSGPTLAAPVAARSEAPIKPLDAAAARAAMAAASQRGQVADALIAYARRRFEVAALLVVRDTLAFGWKGFGPGLDRDRVEALLIPLDATSIYQVALSTGLLYAGPVFPSPLHDHVFKILRCPPPRHAVAAAVVIGKRVVNLLIGHGAGDEELTPDALDELTQVTRAAGEAYVRLIALAKSAVG